MSKNLSIPRKDVNFNITQNIIVTTALAVQTPYAIASPPSCQCDDGERRRRTDRPAMAERSGALKQQAVLKILPFPVQATFTC